MHVVLFTHPTFFNSRSMPKYAGMLSEGLQKRGHSIQVMTAAPFFYKLPSPTFLKKWMGYLDQFVLFPILLKGKLSRMPPNVLFVFSDQALGPWVPYITKRPHVVHCHDFLAQRSAMGEIEENRVSFSGKLYQTLIRRGYRKASNFISISQKTQKDLHKFLNKKPNCSEVVYNGLNQDFRPGDKRQAQRDLENEFKISLENGFILHVGGNQFYKNRKGVISIYSQWRETGGGTLPLLMIGSLPTKELLWRKEDSQFSADIFFLTNVSDSLLQKAYHGASVLLYPSLEEGFGWPIAEAMASGCPVITIDKAPMNEVGGKDCFYLPEPPRESERAAWLFEAARILDQVVNMPKDERGKFVQQADISARRFNSSKAIEKIERVYEDILKSYYVT